jgi:broad specificity phosphatase PhoE
MRRERADVAAMRRPFYYITHPEVTILPEVPIPDWPLSAAGRARMERGLAQPWVPRITSIYASTERKAADAARILAAHRALPFHCIPALGENDRSATGYLPRDEFEAVADRFFACPTEPVRGWERAIDAQARIVAAVAALAAADRTTGAVAIVAHGAVGALLYCHLGSMPIDRRYDQPGNGGGNFFRFTLNPPAAESAWRAIDDLSLQIPNELERP